MPTLAQRSADARSLAETQLAGLKGVNLSVYVDRDLPGADALEKEICAQTKQILTAGSLGGDGPEGVWLSIEVKVYPAEGKLQPDDVLVQVKTELSERVRLVRSKSVKVPHGAITWSDESVRIETKSELRASVVKQVGWSVGLFTDSVKSIRRLPDEAVHDRHR